MTRNTRFIWNASAAAVALTAGIAGIGFASPALAQEARAGAEEIIVTVTRREESVQDVPVAVTAITSEQIEDLAPTTLQDLSGVAPNLYIGMNTAGPGASAIFIRGLGYADIEKTQNPAAGVIIDNVFLGTSTGQLIDTFDLQQVDVTRGPAGIFFGKNTTAGVINVTRSLPTREFGVRASVAGGTDDYTNVRAIVNFPLGENGGIKIGGTRRESSGYLGNVFFRSSDGGTEYTGLNAAIEYDFTPNFGVTFIYDRIEQTGEGSPVQYGNRMTANILSGGNPAAVFGPRYNPRTGSPVGLAVQQVQNSGRDEDSLEMDIYNLTFNVGLPFGDLVWTTGYIDSADIVWQDFDGTCAGSVGCPNTGPVVGNFLLTNAANPTGSLQTIRDQTYTQLSHEARLSGSVGMVDYLIGAYYFEGEVGLVQTTNNAVVQRAGEDSTSTSIFGNLDFNLTDRLTVSIGARSIEEEKTFNARYDIPAVPLVLVPFGTDSDSWSETVTRFAVTYDLGDTTNLYLSRSEGFRSGGFSIRSTLSEQIEGQTNCGITDGDAIPNERLCPNNNFRGYDPELVTAWELGVKNAFIGGNLIVNLALFQTTVENFQQSAVVVTPNFGPGTTTYINNYPEVEIEGAELELVVRPVFMWTGFEGLTLSANIGLQDAQITNGRIDGRRAAGFPNGAAGAPGSTADFTGQRVLRVPDYNITWAAQYERELGPGTLSLGSSYRYIDDHTLANFGAVGDVEEGYALVDANIDYEWNNYRLSVNGKNLGDTEYRNHSLPTVFFQGWGAPATVTVELSAEW
jgi:iron complex outermembrane receptor protein